MVSQKMIDDAEDLAQRGIVLSPREVVRLNALGLRCERGTLNSSLHSIRRCALCGDLSFSEPTIGHAVWMDEVARAYDLDDNMMWFGVRALWLSTVSHEDLPDWRNPETLFTAVKALAETLSRHTLREVSACMDYAEFGNAPEGGENCPRSATSEEQAQLGECLPEENWSAEIGVIREAQMLGLGISIRDACAMTHAQLRRVVDSAFDRLGAKATEGQRETAVGDYEVVLEGIVKAHEAAKEAAANG